MKHALILFFAALAPLMADRSPAEILSDLEKSFAKRSAKFPKADEDALEGDDRTAPLLHFRYLMEMEAILRELLNDEAELKKQVDHEDFSNSEKNRVLEMRADANDYRAAAISSSDFRESRTSPVDKLRKAYERKAKKSLTEISKNRKLVNKEYDRTRPDERRIGQLEAEISQAEQALSGIQIAFFGSVPVKGFEPPFPTDASGPAAKLLKKVITARDQLLTTLRLDPKAVAKDGKMKKGDVGGIQVRSSNLGVVLDNSSSMQPHLPELRKEIDKGFPGSHFREVYGCALTWKPGPTTLTKRNHVLLAMEDLIIVKKTDALYWFSDLRDPQSEAALFRLSELLQRSGALLYVASVDRKPEDELEDLITEFRKK